MADIRGTAERKLHPGVAGRSAGELDELLTGSTAGTDKVARLRIRVEIIVGEIDLNLAIGPARPGHADPGPG